MHWYPAFYPLALPCPAFPHSRFLPTPRRAIPQGDVTKHRTGRTGAKYRSWVFVKCVWCSAYY